MAELLAGESARPVVQPGTRPCLVRSRAATGLVSVVAAWRNQRFRSLIPLQLGTMPAGKWFDWWGGLTWGYRSVVDAAPFLT